MEFILLFGLVARYLKWKRVSVDEQMIDRMNGTQRTVDRYLSAQNTPLKKVIPKILPKHIANRVRTWFVEICCFELQYAP
jgi:hypothetical protein